MLGEAGLAARDARPRLRKPRQGVGTRRVDTWAGQGSLCHAHTPIARPCRAASGCGWHSAPLPP